MQKDNYNQGVYDIYEETLNTVIGSEKTWKKRPESEELGKAYCFDWPEANFPDHIWTIFDYDFRTAANARNTNRVIVEFSTRT